MARGEGRIRRVLAAGALASALVGLAPTATAAGGVTLAEQAARGATDRDTLVFLSTTENRVVFDRGGNQFVSNRSVPAVGPVVAGDLSAAAGTDLLVYAPGGAADGIVHVDGSGTGIGAGFRSETISGRYVPVVGDFDGNGVDDVIFYGPGSAPDSLWLFQPDGTHVARPLSIGGSYVPVVVDARADGADDVLWYGYGEAPDSMWLFAPGAVRTNKAVRIDGRYTPLVGRFFAPPSGYNAEQILFHDAAAGRAVIWTFNDQARQYTVTGLAGGPGSTAVVGGFLGNGYDQIFWYRPGSGGEQWTTYSSGGSTRLDARSVGGTYVPLVGDYDGDGRQDIAWTAGGRATLWMETGRNPGSQRTVNSGLPSAVAAVAVADPADLR